jgi:dephospho-CoA kinase
MARRKVPIIGLVGGIGSGKSTVARVWRTLGCCVSDSDRLARESFDDPAIRKTLREWWGPQAFGADGDPDRAAIAKIVFSDPNQRQRLEGIVHPWIERRRKEHFAAAPDDTVAFVIDAPLLLEAGLDRECDAVVLIDAPQAEREARVLARNGWTADELARREAAQWSLAQKRAKATHVIANDRDIADLEGRAITTLEAIRAKDQHPSIGPANSTRKA